MQAESRSSGALRMSDGRYSPDSFTSMAFRSLFCMFPLNNGYNSTIHDRSDADDE